MRSKSPRTSGSQMKSSPSPNTRSKSVPNAISQTPNKTSKSPSSFRNNKSESSLNSNFSSNSKIEPIFDFFISEISSKPFFPTQRKKELLDLARASKQNGNRYALSHKKSQIISTQFWTTWNSFRNQLEQELNKQLTQNRNSVSRNLSILNDSFNTFKSSKKLGDLQDKESELFSKGNNLPDNIEDITPIMNEFKQFQTDIVRNEYVSKQQALKYKLTSTISQILTLLKSIKDIMMSQIKFENQFENGFSILEGEIPQSVKKSDTNQTPGSSRKNTPTPTKNYIKSKIRPSPSPASKSISPFKSSPSSANHKSDISSEDFEDGFDYVNIQKQPVNETGKKKEKAQVSYSKNLKESKNAAIESKRGSAQPISEISKLQNQIARLSASKNNSKNNNENINDNNDDNIKNNSLSFSSFKNNRKPVQFDVQFDSIADLHDQKRQLTYQNYKLNAICESYLDNISDSNSTMGNLYKQNFELRKQRFKYNEQLFLIRIDNLHTNQISQRATLRPSLLLPSAPDNISFTIDDVKQLKKDYLSTLQINQNARSRLASMKEKREKLENTYAQLMKQKNDSSESKDRNTNIALSELSKVKTEYRSEMSKLLFNQTKAQNDSVQNLKNKTNRSILRMKTKADNDISAIESQKQVSNQSNEQIKQIKKNLQKNIQKITKSEVNSLTEINHSLLKWISQIKTQNVTLATNVKSLVLQYEMMQKKAIDNNFDINAAFSKEIQKIRNENQILRDSLNSSIQKIAQIDIGLGGTKDNVPVDQRLQSIISKIEI